MTSENFIEKARKTHKNKYDYSKVEYKNSSTKVCIICHEKDSKGNEHGEFWQTPASHIYGSGCPKCHHTISLMEENVNDYLTSCGVDTIKNKRNMCFEIDIYSPEKKNRC
jgi:hypothetical protein